MQARRRAPGSLQVPQVGCAPTGRAYRFDCFVRTRG